MGTDWDTTRRKILLAGCWQWVFYVEQILPRQYFCARLQGRFTHLTG